MWLFSATTRHQPKWTQKIPISQVRSGSQAVLLRRRRGGVGFFALLCRLGFVLCFGVSTTPRSFSAEIDRSQKFGWISYRTVHASELRDVVFSNRKLRLKQTTFCQSSPQFEFTHHNPVITKSQHISPPFVLIFFTFSLASTQPPSKRLSDHQSIQLNSITHPAQHLSTLASKQGFWHGWMDGRYGGVHG